MIRRLSHSRAHTSNLVMPVSISAGEGKRREREQDRQQTFIASEEEDASEGGAGIDLVC